MPCLFAPQLTDKACWKEVAVILMQLPSVNTKQNQSAGLVQAVATSQATLINPLIPDAAFRLDCLDIRTVDICFCDITLSASASWMWRF
jgi:hypothetical protein